MNRSSLAPHHRPTRAENPFIGAGDKHAAPGNSGHGDEGSRFVQSICSEREGRLRLCEMLRWDGMVRTVLSDSMEGGWMDGGGGGGLGRSRQMNGVVSWHVHRMRDGGRAESQFFASEI